MHKPKLASSLVYSLVVGSHYQIRATSERVHKQAQSESEKQKALSKAELKRQIKNAKRLRNKNV